MEEQVIGRTLQARRQPCPQRTVRTVCGADARRLFVVTPVTGKLAQDLMHDGFLKLFDSFDKFTWRGEGSLRAWMERVMVNTVLQYLRKMM